MVVSDIEDYERSGVSVVAIVGVGASPSCGVTTTLDLRRSFEVIASCPLTELDRETINRTAIADCRIAGEGLPADRDGNSHGLTARRDNAGWLCFNVSRMKHGTHTASLTSRFAAPTRAYFYFWRFI